MCLPETVILDEDCVWEAHSFQIACNDIIPTL